MIKAMIGLSAEPKDIIYWGNRNTGETEEFIVQSIIIKDTNETLSYEYYDKEGVYICNEEDLRRNQFLTKDVFCLNGALREAYLKKKKQENNNE